MAMGATPAIRCGWTRSRSPTGESRAALSRRTSTAPSRVILVVEAMPAFFHQETVAARTTMERVEKLGIHPESVGADKAYGSGEFLAWRLARGHATAHSRHRSSSPD